MMRQTETPAPRKYAPLMTLVSMAMLGIAGYVWYTAGHNGQPASHPPRQGLGKEVLAKARTAIANGQLEPARDLMLAYVRANPADAEVRPLLARTLWNLGQDEQAQKVLEELQKINPGLAQTYWLAGEIAKSEGNADYMKYFAQAVNSPTVEPGMLSAYALELLAAGKDDDAQKYLDRSVSAGHSDAATLQGLGDLALRHKNPAKAADLLRESIKLDPTQSAPWRLLAAAQRQMGQADQAAKTLQDALGATRDRAAIYYQLGTLRQSQSQPAEAADAFAAAADPEILDKASRVQAATNAAVEYFQLGRFALAMKYIDLALALDPQNAQARQWVTRIEDARFGRPTSQPKK